MKSMGRPPERTGSDNDWQTIGSERDAYLTLYGKKEARDGRKMGHITRLKPRS